MHAFRARFLAYMHAYIHTYIQKHMHTLITYIHTRIHTQTAGKPILGMRSTGGPASVRPISPQVM